MLWAFCAYKVLLEQEAEGAWRAGRASAAVSRSSRFLLWCSQHQLREEEAPFLVFLSVCVSVYQCVSLSLRVCMSFVSVSL